MIFAKFSSNSMFRNFWTKKDFCQYLRYTKLSLRFSRILEFSLRHNGNVNHSNLKKFPTFSSPSQQKNECQQSNFPLGITRDFHDNFPLFIGISRRDSRSDFFYGEFRALLWKIFVEMSFIRRWAWKASEASPRDAKVRIILFFVQKFNFLKKLGNFHTNLAKKLKL